MNPSKTKKGASPEVVCPPSRKSDRDSDWECLLRSILLAPANFATPSSSGTPCPNGGRFLSIATFSESNSAGSRLSRTPSAVGRRVSPVRGDGRRPCGTSPHSSGRSNSTSTTCRRRPDGTSAGNPRPRTGSRPMPAPGVIGGKASRALARDGVFPPRPPRGGGRVIPDSRPQRPPLAHASSF